MRVRVRVCNLHAPHLQCVDRSQEARYGVRGGEGGDVQVTPIILKPIREARLRGVCVWGVCVFVCTHASACV